MALRNWQSVNSNWNDVANWSGAAVPVSNDVVTIPQDSTIAPTDGMSQAAVDLDELRIEPGCLVNVGSESIPLNISADKVIHNGTGTLFVDCGTANIDEMIIDAPNWVQAAWLTDKALPGIVDRLVVIRGKVKAVNFTCIQAMVTFRSNPLGDAILDWTDAGNFYPAFFLINGGHTEVGASDLGPISSPRIYIADGRILFNRDSFQNIDRLHQSGGFVDIRGDYSGGTIADRVLATAVISGGVMTMENDSRPKTILNLLVMPGGVALLPNTVTVTNGGSMVPPPIVR